MSQALSELLELQQFYLDKVINEAGLENEDDIRAVRIASQDDWMAGAKAAVIALGRTKGKVSLQHAIEAILAHEAISKDDETFFNQWQQRQQS